MKECWHRPPTKNDGASLHCTFTTESPAIAGILELKGFCAQQRAIMLLRYLQPREWHVFRKGAR